MIQLTSTRLFPCLSLSIGLEYHGFDMLEQNGLKRQKPTRYGIAREHLLLYPSINKAIWPMIFTTSFILMSKMMLNLDKRARDASFINVD